MKAKITKRLIDSLKPGAKDYYVFDSQLTGFVVRVRATGGMTYAVQYRSGKGRSAPTRRVTLGSVTRLTPDQARKAAENVLGAVGMGGDPAAEKASQRSALSLREVADRYLADHAAKRKGSTHVLVTGILERNLLPVFGAMQPDKVTRADVARLHSAMHATPVAANRTLATLKALYGWAARHELVADGYNPARSIEKYAERARERFLTSDEFARLGDALDTCAVDPAAVAAIKLLILTGCRLREILELRWDYVDFDRAVIFLPDSKTGKKPVYLSAAALGILRNLPRRSDYVAPSRTGRPYADIKGPWATVTGVAGLEGLRLHDLRHSFASIGAGAGLGLPILGKLLGHSQAATTQRYAHLASDPMHQAVNTIGDAIEAAMKGADRKVVPLRKIAPDRG